MAKVRRDSMGVPQGGGSRRPSVTVQRTRRVLIGHDSFGIPRYKTVPVGSAGGRHASLTRRTAPAQRPTGQGPGLLSGIAKTVGRAGRSVSAAHVNVAHLQHSLNNAGYKVKVDGQIGPKTIRALHHAISSGKFSGGGGGGGGGNNGKVNMRGTQQALKAATGHAIPAADANFGQLFNVDQMAKALANEQYGAQVNDAQLQVNRDPRQAAQNEADVKNWYNQVLGAQAAAGKADTAATNAGVGSVNAANQALVQSLGGSANQGAGEAAAAGQNAAGTLQAIGNSQSGLDAELAPILKAQAAQQRTDQANIDQTKQANDQQALRDLQGQMGNAETGAQMQLMSANNSLDQARQQALLNILQYNNSLGQQKFQNQLGMTDAQIAAAMNGVSMAEKGAMMNYYNSRAQHYASGGSLSPSELNDVSKQLIGELGSRGLIVSPSSGVYKLAPGVTPGQVLSASRTITSGYGNLPGGWLPGVLTGIQGY